MILVVGVNGTGKTTTIGKLAMRLREHGLHVVVGAADTFRAAAEEQLEIWAERAGAVVRRGERGGDQPRSPTTRSSAQSATASTS